MFRTCSAFARTIAIVLVIGAAPVAHAHRSEAVSASGRRVIGTTSIIEGTYQPSLATRARLAAQRGVDRARGGVARVRAAGRWAGATLRSPDARARTSVGAVVGLRVTLPDRLFEFLPSWVRPLSRLLSAGPSVSFWSGNARQWRARRAGGSLESPLFGIGFSTLGIGRSNVLGRTASAGLGIISAQVSERGGHLQLGHPTLVALTVAKLNRLSEVNRDAASLSLGSGIDTTWFGLPFIVTLQLEVYSPLFDPLWSRLEPIARTIQDRYLRRSR